MHRVDGDALRLGELIAVDRRRIDVDPADAEAHAGRGVRTGERQQDRPHPRASTIPFSSIPHRGSPRLSGSEERLVQVRLDVVERFDAEDAALAAGVLRA